jgi:hypothetical protein
MLSLVAEAAEQVVQALPQEFIQVLKVVQALWAKVVPDEPVLSPELLLYMPAVVAVVAHIQKAYLALLVVPAAAAEVLELT